MPVILYSWIFCEKWGWCELGTEPSEGIRFTVRMKLSVQPPGMKVESPECFGAYTGLRALPTPHGTEWPIGMHQHCHMMGRRVSHMLLHTRKYWIFILALQVGS